MLYPNALGSNALIRCINDDNSGGSGDAAALEHDVCAVVSSYSMGIVVVMVAIVVAGNGQLRGGFFYCQEG